MKKIIERARYKSMRDSANIKIIVGSVAVLPLMSGTMVKNSEK
jgi:hypothetical protein